MAPLAVALAFAVDFAFAVAFAFAVVFAFAVALTFAVVFAFPVDLCSLAVAVDFGRHSERSEESLLPFAVAVASVVAVAVLPLSLILAVLLERSEVFKAWGFLLTCAFRSHS